MKTFSLLSFILAFAAPSQAASAASPAGLARIGAAAAVRGAVRATAPNAVGRVIESGKPLFLNDHVTTDAAGKLQVLLLDETVFTLGPNADMVLDTFVYDPNSGAGEVAASITKGAFRFVTGKVARNKPENMNVKLKVGTIGVRGTVVVGQTSDAGSTIINAGASPDNQAGEQGSNVLAQNNGETTLLNRPGDGVRVLPGQKPGSAGDFTAELDRISNTLGEPIKIGKAGNDPAGNANDESGQATGSGIGNAGDGTAAALASEESGALITAARQQSFGIAKWEDLFLLQGRATYSGTGSYVCTGGSGPNCGAGIPGTMAFGLEVNFDAKTLGGGASAITLSGPVTDNTNVQLQSYASLSGPAQTALIVVNGQFNGTSVKFTNANGKAASEAQVQLRYADVSSHSLTGTANGAR